MNYLLNCETGQATTAVLEHLSKDLKKIYNVSFIEAAQEVGLQIMPVPVTKQKTKTEILNEKVKAVKEFKKDVENLWKVTSVERSD